MRIGFGYDIHPLVPNRPLILGGIHVPFHKGPTGHSDADVLCHAIGDALLGAASLGDIGEHFPDSDPQFKNADSLVLLGRILEKISAAAFVVRNVDATVVLEVPSLGPFKKAMGERVANALRLSRNEVSIKAKTNERFEAVGKGEAVAAFAVVLLEASGADGRP